VATIVFPHTNCCNVGTIELYLVGEIKQHGPGQEKYYVLIITII